MSLTKVSYSMIDGAVLNVTDFGADPTGATDSTAAIQAALDANGDVWFPAGKYIITDSLNLSLSKRIIGESGLPVEGAPNFVPGSIRNQVAILPRQSGNLSALGNYPVFKNKTGTTGYQYHIEGFNIFWENVTPTNSGTQGNRIAFKFVPDGVAQYTAPYSNFTDIEVNGAWQVYYDDSDNYKNNFTRVVGRFSKYGFYKRLGTMMVFESCGNSIGDQAFYFDNVISPTLVNCSGDTLIPDANTTGKAAVYFVDCKSVTINGWDVEAATISGNGYSYFNFTRSYASVAGVTGINNYLNCNSGEFVSWVLITDNSNVTISAFNRIANSSGVFYFIGTSGGDCAVIRSIVNSNCTVLNSNVQAPTGGSPTNRYSVYAVGGYATLIGSIWDNQYEISARISQDTIASRYFNATRSVIISTQFFSSESAAPTTGTHSVGDIVFNSAPVAGGTIGWVCTTAGTPGTWKTFGAIAA